MLFPFVSRRKKCCVIFLLCFCSLIGYLMFILFGDEAEDSSYDKVEVQEKFSPFVSDDLLDKCLKHRNTSYAFTQMMNEMNIEAVLVEPSALFCLMSSTSKLQLKKKGFKISDYPQSKTITRFALIGKMAEEIKMLDYEASLKDHGFYYEGVIDHSINVSSASQNYKISHHFFARAGEVIHAVVLRERGDYYWLKKITSVPRFQHFEAGDFRFYENDTAYEKFSVHWLISARHDILAVPRDTGCFLHQLSSAKFLECDMSRLKYLVNDTDYKRKLEVSFLNALKELKLHLQPLLIDFFLCGGTLLGWYRQCGIIPYTSDIDFAAWASDAGYDWIRAFRNRPKLRLITTFGLPEEAYELRFYSKKMRVDLFFVYKDKNTTWVSGHYPSKGYYFRYTYPTFSVCSADLLGHKVLVPCETLQILLADYGPNWVKPVADWYYNSSPKNMGPHIYWPDDVKDKVHKQF